MARSVKKPGKISASVLLAIHPLSMSSPLVQFLKKAVKRLYFTADGHEADKLIRQYQPDIVCSSVRLPGSGGLKLAGTVRELGLPTRFILICPRNPGSAFAMAVDAGISRFLVVPVKTNRLDRILRDIDRELELGRTAREQSDSIQKLSRAVEQSPNSVMMTDLFGTIEYVNPKFEEITGYRKADVIGANAGILKSGKTSPEVYLGLRSTLSAGRIWKGEFINRRKNGELYWEMASISPIKNEKGVITHYVSVSEDFTEKKQADEALLLSERNLRRRNDAMEQDLKNAQTIQRALLPKIIPDIPELRIDYRYIPMESVGGDYFSFTQLREGGMGVFLGDVTGHGVSAALFLALVKAFTDRACRRYGQKPREYLTHLNNDLQNNMTTNFLTAVYGYFRFGTDDVSFTFAKGGHPPPLIFRAASGTVEIPDSDGSLLGMMQSINFEEKTIILKPGDRLYLYTDGIHETVDGENNMFGLEGLRAVLPAVNRGTLSQSLDGIIHSVNDFRGDAPVKDDIVLLGFEARKPAIPPETPRTVGSGDSPQ